MRGLKVAVVRPPFLKDFPPTRTDGMIMGMEKASRYFYQLAYMPI